jgi:hypothetical protein
MFGSTVTNFIISQTQRCLAIQYTHELASDMGLKGAGDVSGVASFFTRLLIACGQKFETEQLSPSRYRIVLSTFKPFDSDAYDGLREAWFAFQQMSARLISPRVAVGRRYESDHEVWEIEDVGHWRW